MHWAQVKDAYDKGFFHLPRHHKNQQNTSLHEEFNITPCLKSPVENSEETSDKNNMSLAICKRQAWNEVPLSTGKPSYLETGSQALFREPNRFTLPPLAALIVCWESRDISSGQPYERSANFSYADFQYGCYHASCTASSRRHPTDARQLP